jgi:glycogen operon protein
VRDLATRLAGSVDLFGHSDPPLIRGPGASVNYVTAHDGFTLADLVA